MKAVIEVGSKQFLVEKNDEILVDIAKTNEKTLNYIPLMIIDGDNIEVGTPYCDKSNVTCEMIDDLVKADKVLSIRYKAKKRVHKVRGHRQKLAKLKVVKVS